MSILNKTDITSVVIQFLQADGRSRKRVVLKRPMTRGAFIDWKTGIERKPCIFSVIGVVGSSGSSV